MGGVGLHKSSGLLALTILFRLERNKEAVQDANKALQNDKQNSRAITAKAEALFNSGKFEKALVQFEKGHKIRRDPKTTEGLMKCTQAILSSIGQNGIVFEKELVIFAIKETKLERGRKEQRRKEKEWNSVLVKKPEEEAVLKLPHIREPTLA